MGNGASGEVTYNDPMYGGYHGYPRPAVQSQNPRARGPRSFEELDSHPSQNNGLVQGSAVRTNHQHSTMATPSAPPPPSNPSSSGLSQAQVLQNASKHTSQMTEKGKGGAKKKTLPAVEDNYMDDDIVFETFYHRNGETYTCMYQAKQRFVMNSWADGEWVPFPDDWYDKGILVTENVVSGGENSDLDEGAIEQLVYGSAAPVLAKQNGSQTQSAPTVAIKDDREGKIHHPRKGIIFTYMFEAKRNVHCYFDDEAGTWVKLPIAWELHSETVKDLVAQVEDQIPEWTDRQDILAALRASNYDVYECVTTWRILGEQKSMAAPRNRLDDKQNKVKEALITDLEMKLKQTNDKYRRALGQISVLTSENESGRKLISHLREKVAELEVAKHSMKSRVDSLNAQLSQYNESNQIKEQVEEESKQLTVASKKNSLDIKIVKRCAHHAGLLAKSYHTLRMEIEDGFSSCSELLKKAVKTAMKMPNLSEMKSAEEVEELKALYRKECLLRKLLYNQVQELRGNIRVYARCRYDERAKCVLHFPTDEDISVADVKGNKRLFKFDHVYSPESTQEEVFHETCPIVTSCVDGYNVCILAYGQTGSGKTFTMMGPKNNPGVNIRAISELLRITDERPNVEYELKVSMVEIYNEIIQDLLTEECKVVTLQQVRTTVNIQGLSEHRVRTHDDITKLMDLGMTNRTVASTKMNSESSRSHLLVMLTVEGCDLTSHAKSKGTLTLVDLAGSERVSKTDASGQRLVEAAAINKSLTALGQVFAALGKSSLHIPFRNCKLTQLLQPSLSGDAKAALFVAVSPADSNLSETLSTLTFGANAKQVELGQAKKNIISKKS